MNKYEAQIPVPPARPARKKMVRFDIANAGSFCGIDSIRAFRILDVPMETKETMGETGTDPHDLYNRRQGVLVNIKNFFSVIDRLLIGKPAIIVFSRPSNWKGTHELEFENQELMEMFDKDGRCHRLCDWLNRTGPHRDNPNHLRLYYYLGTHDEPEDLK